MTKEINLYPTPYQVNMPGCGRKPGAVFRVCGGNFLEIYDFMVNAYYTSYNREKRALTNVLWVSPALFMGFRAKISALNILSASA